MTDSIVIARAEQEIKRIAKVTADSQLIFSTRLWEIRQLTYKNTKKIMIIL